MSDWQKRYQRLLFDRPHPKVLRVTMNRPEKYNATDSIMHTELVNVWRDIDGDDTVNCVIIQGAGGKVFSAGGDFDLIEKNMKDFNALLRTWKEARDELGDDTGRDLHAERRGGTRGGLRPSPVPRQRLGPPGPRLAAAVPRGPAPGAPAEPRDVGARKPLDRTTGETP